MDTKCRVYVLSSDFAKWNGIWEISMKPRLVDLVVSNARVQLTYKTASLKLRIERTMIRKSLYLLLISQFDAIVGMFFFRKNEMNLAELEFGIIEVNESKMSIDKGDISMDMNMDESSGSTEMIEMITISQHQQF